MTFARRSEVTAAALAVVVLGASATGGGPAATAGTAPEPTRAPALLPNMTPLKAKDVHIARTDGTRWLRFESGLANIGRGPVEVRPNDAKRCPGAQRHASQIVYHGVAWCSTVGTTTGTSRLPLATHCAARPGTASSSPARR